MELWVLARVEEFCIIVKGIELDEFETRLEMAEDDCENAHCDLDAQMAKTTGTVATMLRISERCDGCRLML